MCSVGPNQQEAGCEARAAKQSERCIITQAGRRHGVNTEVTHGVTQRLLCLAAGKLRAVLGRKGIESQVRGAGS